MPNLEMSNLEAPVAMSSIPQQARPMGMGHNELLRIQLIAASSLVNVTLPSIFESYATGAVFFGMDKVAI
jgi:hypothetical protein